MPLDNDEAVRPCVASGLHGARNRFGGVAQRSAASSRGIPAETGADSALEPSASSCTALSVRFPSRGDVAATRGEQPRPQISPAFAGLRRKVRTRMEDGFRGIVRGHARLPPSISALRRCSPVQAVERSKTFVEIRINAGKEERIVSSGPRSQKAETRESDLRIFQNCRISPALPGRQKKNFDNCQAFVFSSS